VGAALYGLLLVALLVARVCLGDAAALAVFVVLMLVTVVILAENGRG
jgi:hypothetical protein